MEQVTGRILSNRYELLERVGGGGMAFVYRARDLLLDRIVAVKILSPHFTGDEDFVRKFRREAQAAARLSSPNIVSVYDVGQDGDVHYIVMEFLHGKTLKQVLNEKGPLAVADALQIGRQIAEALQVAHKYGVIHRDIKPHNIMLTPDGHVKVADFGIARAATTSTLTDSGALMGSVHYISPEQARGGIVGERSDIYSLGVVLYELLTGQVPFTGDSMFSIALKHLQETPKSLREINPDIPARVEQVVAKAMSKDQASRYQTADELAADLQKLLQEEQQTDDLAALVDDLTASTRGDTSALEKTIAGPEHQPAAKESRESRPQARKRPWWQYIIATGGVLLLISFIFLFWWFRPGAIVEVPNVVGMTLSDAQRVLSARSLGFIVGSEQYSDAEPNVVLSQDLPEGRKVRAGRTITLVISKGPEYAEVPDVVGKPLRIAQVELQNAGFVADPINRVYSDQPVDEVVGQNPVGNTRLKRSTPIMLTVSQGPAPQPFVLPSFRGQTATEAQQHLAELGLVLGDTSGPMVDGIVVEQTPASGTPVLPGQTISLKFGPKEVTAIASYTVPANSERNNHQIEVYREDVNGVVLEYSARHKRGETIQWNLTGAGFLRITIKDDGQVVKEEVYP